MKKSSLKAEFLEFNNKNLEHLYYLSLAPEAYSFGTIYIESPLEEIYIKSSIFKENQFSLNGGARYFISEDILVNDSNAESLPFINIEYCSFYDNEVREKGGAIFVWSQNVRIQGSLLKGNRANSGGALYLGSPGKK